MPCYEGIQQSCVHVMSLSMMDRAESHNQSLPCAVGQAFGSSGQSHLPMRSARARELLPTPGEIGKTVRCRFEACSFCHMSSLTFSWRFFQLIPFLHFGWCELNRLPVHHWWVPFWLYICGVMETVVRPRKSSRARVSDRGVPQRVGMGSAQKNQLKPAAQPHAATL